jgi:L-alanine-DL-glutamate epimerase-like enolase superfamily enzyme
MQAVGSRAWRGDCDARSRTTVVVPITESRVSAYTIPTHGLESDGTLEWTSTTIVIVEISAGHVAGVGHTYGHKAIATLIADLLFPLVRGRNAMDVNGSWIAMTRAIRNQGRPGISSMAIAAVDAALWDLKARLLHVPLVTLLGAARDAIPVYGSGGFTSLTVDGLQRQLAGWVERGITAVKMKVGRQPHEDDFRVRMARAAIGPSTALFVDANGAYDARQALTHAEAFADSGVVWFEEPVSSDDLEGLRFVRDRAPAGIDIAAGEYGYDLYYFRRMLDAGAVDVLQADATRCAGISGFMQVAALCDAYNMPLSAHTAPALHLHPCCASAWVRHVEYFYDHERIERILFDGVIEPVGGMLRPDLSRPGLGLELKRADVAALKRQQALIEA